MIKKLWVLLPIAVVASASVSAQDLNAHSSLKHTIEKAIERFEQSPRSDWSYEVSRYENEEGKVTSSIERFDPRREALQQWTLLSINGQPPTPQQAQEFASKNRDDETEGANVVVKLADLIQLDSLELISEDDSHISAEFDVFLERLGRDASEHLKGELLYSKDASFIENLEIRNTASFSPVFSANISDFMFELSFIKIDTAIFVKEVSLDMKGKFAVFVTIDERSKDTYSNFEYWGNSQSLSLD